MVLGVAGAGIHRKGGIAVSCPDCEELQARLARVKPLDDPRMQARADELRRLCGPFMPAWPERLAELEHERESALAQLATVRHAFAHAHDQLSDESGWNQELVEHIERMRHVVHQAHHEGEPAQCKTGVCGWRIPRQVGP
jgi:hypothetical protein